MSEPKCLNRTPEMHGPCGICAVCAPFIATSADKILADLRAALASLITQWRQIASQHDNWKALSAGEYSEALVASHRQCADELEALLTPVAPTPEPPK